MTAQQPALLVIGATSDIGRAIAHEYAAHGYRLQLAARDTEQAEKDAEDLRIRYQVPVAVHPLDILEPADREALMAGLHPLPSRVVCAVGLMADQTVCEQDPELADRVMRTNFNGPALLLGRLADDMARRGEGAIIGISSVAGDRGRASNYVYGAAKAGFSAWLSGLRNRLAGSGVRVLTVKPGFVATAMTEGMDLPGPLTSTPAKLARAVRRADQRGKDVLYHLRLWYWIMLVIRLLPEGVFKRTSL